MTLDDWRALAVECGADPSIVQFEQRGGVMLWAGPAQARIDRWEPPVPPFGRWCYGLNDRAGRAGSDNDPAVAMRGAVECLRKQLWTKRAAVNAALALTGVQSPDVDVMADELRAAHKALGDDDQPSLVGAIRELRWQRDEAQAELHETLELRA